MWVRETQRPFLKCNTAGFRGARDEWITLRAVYKTQSRLPPNRLCLPFNQTARWCTVRSDRKEGLEWGVGRKSNSDVELMEAVRRPPFLPLQSTYRKQIEQCFVEWPIQFQHHRQRMVNKCNETVPWSPRRRPHMYGHLWKKSSACRGQACMRQHQGRRKSQDENRTNRNQQPRLKAVKETTWQSTVIIRLIGQSEEEAAGGWWWLDDSGDKYADGGSCVGGDVTLISGTLQDSQMCPSQKQKD